ncbi:MAG TPA: hypothetical protein VL172_02770 [Kofleriaceae bacterium]|nr:hypothetical protein [Kofleriaceae bacterium]
MKQTIFLSAIATVLYTAAPAHAQARSGIGVGVETTVTSELVAPYPGVATLTYDTGVFQIEGLLTFISYDNNVTYLGAGGKFWYGIHRGERSDFSVGGGLAIINTNPDGPGDSATDFHLEGGAKIRAFLTPNVALSTTLGLGIVIADNDGPNDDVFGIAGNLLGSVGLSYYFW